MNTQQKIDLFFAPPDPEQLGPQFSTLYLARREIQECLFDVPGDENTILTVSMKHRRLFAAAGVMWSALDLLAMCYAGDDTRGKLGERFRTFAVKYVVCSTAEPDAFADVLYEGCRNPLIHSFGPHSREHRVYLIGNVAGLDVIQRQTQEPDVFLVSIEGLYWRFVSAVSAYEKEVRASSELQLKFEPMFDRYGSLWVGTTTV